MNYIYNITTNLNNYAIDWFEWNYNDLILFFRKIPIVKVDEITFKSINNNIFKIYDLLELIEKKSFVYNNFKKINLINVCAFCNNYKVIIVKFNKLGESINRGYIYYDEEELLKNYFFNLKEVNIKYRIVKKIMNDGLTRNEKKKYNYIKRYIISCNDYNQLIYLYYDCTGIYAYEKIKEKILYLLKNDWNLFNEKIYMFIKLFSMN